MVEQDQSKQIEPRERELTVKNVLKEPSQHKLFKTCHRFANLDQQHPSLKVYKQTNKQTNKQNK